MKIGVFDSGLGGLVITRAFVEALPEYDYVYYGDTARLPYGEKTSGQILSYTIEAIFMKILGELPEPCMARKKNSFASSTYPVPNNRLPQ